MTEPVPRASLLAFVHRCQVAIGGLHPLGTSDLGEMWGAFSRPPVTNTKGERLIVAALVADVLTRLREQGRITRVPAWAELRALFDDRSPEGVNRRLAMFRLLEVQGSRRGRPGSPNLVGQALRLLEESYGDPNESLARVAKHLRVTAGHLGRVLRRRTGRPFRRHLHEIRMRHAALLLDGNSSVKEIATAVGYPSVSEFDRHFRATFGMTPSAFRLVAVTPRDRARAKSDVHIDS